MNSSPFPLLPVAIIAFFILSIFSTGCFEDTAKFEAEFKNAVDTIYLRQVRSFNEELDSICAAQKDSLIESSMDSIREVRLQAIEKLIKK